MYIYNVHVYMYNVYLIVVVTLTPQALTAGAEEKTPSGLPPHYHDDEELYVGQRLRSEVDKSHHSREQTTAAT